MKTINVPEMKSVAIESLSVDEKNPNEMTPEKRSALKKNIERYGFIVPVVTNENLVIADGQHRWEVARELGMKRIPVIQIPLEEVDRRILRQVLNKLRGEHDENLDYEEYKAILEAQGDFKLLASLLAEDEARFNQLIRKVEFIAKAPEDSIPDKAPSRCSKGDLWLLGNHRLLCGDATSVGDAKRLMGGELADMVFTDPPYGVSYTAKNEYLNSLGKPMSFPKAIESDDKSVNEMFTLWKTLFDTTAEHTTDKATYYVCSPQGGELMMMMMMAIDESPWSLKHTIIWNKNNHVLGRCDYHYKHEPILYGWKKKGTHKFYKKGEHTKSVWDINKPHSSKLHPTMKPIELIQNALLNSSLPEQTIIDFFGGSGSTLIACEKTSRRCFMMEIDPHYCDVIIKRWEEYTGKKGKKED